MGLPSLAKGIRPCPLPLILSQSSFMNPTLLKQRKLNFANASCISNQLPCSSVTTSHHCYRYFSNQQRLSYQKELAPLPCCLFPLLLQLSNEFGTKLVALFLLNTVFIVILSSFLVISSLFFFVSRISK